VAESLLFVDRLGMKAALRHGTTAGQQHLNAFQDRLADALANCHPADMRVESDSGVAIFEGIEEAVVCGEQIFKTMFDAADPIWMRGVIVGCEGVVRIDDLITERNRGGVIVRSPGPALLEALVAEKSGFKGFRLRVKASLLDANARNALRKHVMTEDPYDAVAPPTAWVYRTKALRNANAPLDDGFEDVLWMLDDEPRFNERDSELSYRLRRSGRDLAEAEQAAMTKVVFEEARAIAGIVLR
jgi:hypothetical protein